MDWLRSEDLKEEKALTTSKHTIARQEPICSFQIDLVGAQFEEVPRWSHPEDYSAEGSRVARAIARQPQMHFPPDASRAQHDALPHEGVALSLLMFPLRGHRANY